MSGVEFELVTKKKAKTGSAAGGGGRAGVVAPTAAQGGGWKPAEPKKAGPNSKVTYYTDKKTGKRHWRRKNDDGTVTPITDPKAVEDLDRKQGLIPPVGYTAPAAVAEGAGTAEAGTESDDEMVVRFKTGPGTDGKTTPAEEEKRPGRPDPEDGKHEDKTLDDLPTDTDPTKTPPIVPGINRPGDDLPGQTFNPAEIPGMSWVPGAIGAGLGLLSGLRPEPQFNRMETMNKWDDYGRGKFKGIWKDSETNPVEGDYYRNAQRTAITSTNAMIENDAQKQAMQAASAGGTVFAGGNQRAMAAMAPALYGQMAQNLSRGYQIRDDAAQFRESLMFRNTNEAKDSWDKDYDYGRLTEQNQGAWLIDKAAKNTVAGLGQGLNLASQLHDMDITNKILEKSLGTYTLDPADTGAMLEKSIEQSGKGLLDIESMPDLEITPQIPEQNVPTYTPPQGMNPQADMMNIGVYDNPNAPYPRTVNQYGFNNPVFDGQQQPIPGPYNPATATPGTPGMHKVDELLGGRSLQGLPADTPGIGWMKSTDLIRPDQPINMPQPMPVGPLPRPNPQPQPAPAPGGPVPDNGGPTASMNADTTRGPVQRTDYAGLLETQRLQDEMKKKQKKSLGLNLAAGLVQAGASLLPGVGPIAGSLAGGLMRRMA